MKLIDTHCHLTRLTAGELNAVFENADKVGVTRMICIGAGDGDQSAASAVSLAESHDRIWATVGVHPHDAGKVAGLDSIEKLASHPKVVAIGETGLDFFRDWAPRDRQFSLFRDTIQLAKRAKKKLVIHSRDAREDVFQVLKEEGADEIGGVFHCYAEDAPFAARLRDLNFLVSFTGNITFKKAGALRDAVRDIPLDQIMLETDAPYMAPEPFRGKTSEPMHVYQVALRIADVKGLNLEEVTRQTTLNAERFFALPTLLPAHG